MRFAGVLLCVGAALAVPTSRYAKQSAVEPPAPAKLVSDLSTYDPDTEAEPKIPDDEDINERQVSRKAEHDRMVAQHKADKEQAKKQNMHRLAQKKEQHETEVAKKALLKEQADAQKATETIPGMRR